MVLDLLLIGLYAGFKPDQSRAFLARFRASVTGSPQLLSSR
jgi:hypothetical protein